MHMRSVGRFKTCSGTFLQEQNACMLSTSCTCGTGLNKPKQCNAKCEHTSWLESEGTSNLNVTKKE